MEKQFVPYELALKLKELGFKEECFKWWGSDGILNQKYNLSNTILAPLWQQAFDWFRNEYNLEGNIKSWREGENKYYYYSVNELYRTSTYRLKFDTKEQARLECLKNLIEIVRND